MLTKKAPIWEAVQYQKKVFYAGHNGSSPYMGLPSPGLDEAWANITEGHLILINSTGVEALGFSTTNATNVDGLYFAVPEYYHQMHCLDNIRKYIFRDSYPDFLPFHGTDEQVWGHVDHCIDLLRQRIMCTADVGLIIYYWEGPERIPKANFATEHMCRNLDAIDGWVRDHSWEEGKQLKDLVYPQQRHAGT
ncbi:hypothetical protein AUEXF2481DRAFT_346613 [Aureobasidium subglaciale EXF-2481]|uniref:Uncharacterized protein n=1 Tax=Aureobasidium subglaciale (strain EXF-2481) TaxID=1043005 RepID=A0A074YAP3_AURSE|nr:uncharacterized protein AUEXF2481DRAFT_346613 [Aureobasidium subglaciale EXF-2481]KEQ93034.1 hypothetical protein AUEXF2481DRAFT_346613 [Aureobasidium subglaciale EXF-2481]